ISGTVAVTQSGTWTVQPVQSGTWNVNLNGIGTTSYGSPAVQALDVYVVNSPTTCVTQCTSPWVVSGTVAATQSGTWTVGITGQTYTAVGSPAVSSLNVFVEGGNVVVSGTVSISGTVTVTGTVAATQSGTWTVQQGGAPWTVNLGNVGTTSYGSPAVQALDVYVVNSPTTCVTQCTSPWVVSGTVSVSGTVAVTQSGTWTV